jgi:hypothetical protein
MLLCRLRRQIKTAQTMITHQRDRVCGSLARIIHDPSKAVRVLIDNSDTTNMTQPSTARQTSQPRRLG